MSVENQQIVIIKAENKPGVLSKISSLCRRRRYNIKSLTAGTTHIKNISQVTLIFSENEDRMENIVNQIDKIVEVVSIKLVESKDIIDKELVLLVVKDDKIADKILKNGIHNVSARVINTVGKCFVLEIVGEGREVDHILGDLDFEKDVVKMARSGLVALEL
ncbi:MAG: acetolactate synthase small subunit [Candidatus Pacebacteria bacterium]|nr:acetolactate synthase small subunit [Candidatus Paceibacterota bacterium]